jgi:hypothetical protein
LRRVRLRRRLLVALTLCSPLLGLRHRLVARRQQQWRRRRRRRRQQQQRQQQRRPSHCRRWLVVAIPTSGLKLPQLATLLPMATTLPRRHP